MIRPATPLSIILFIAFALELISVLSTPIIKGISLATYGGVSYGVFGYCQGGVCTSMRIGYTPPTQENNDFSLGSSVRLTLTDILIVHPVACLLTLLCFLLSLAAHLHKTSHSSRYLLGLIIFMLPTLLISLLAFLVDILLFTPHLSWAGWIVLAATVLIAICGVMLCGMRRTLVSRKARKKRIAENAEMSGENYRSHQGQMPPRADSPPPLTQQPGAPMVNGALGAEKLTAVATFESSTATHISDDDRVPLNGGAYTAPDASPALATVVSEDGMGMDRYGATRGGGMGRGRGGRFANGPRDEYGNPLPPSAAFGPRPPRQPPSALDPRIQGPNDMHNGRGGYRGRGGPPPRGGYARGGPYGGRGGPSNGNGRGGVPGGAPAMGVAAGAVAGEMGRGQRGPPPGYGDDYSLREKRTSGQYGSPGPYGRRPSPGPPSAPGYARRPSEGALPTAYGRRQSPGPPSALGYGRNSSPGLPSAPGYGRNPSPGPPSAPGYGSQQSPGLARAESPPPLPGTGVRHARAEPPPPLANTGADYVRAESPPPLRSTGVGYVGAKSPQPPLAAGHSDAAIGQAIEMDAMILPPPGPIGQAVEMDANTGSPAFAPKGFGQLPGEGQVAPPDSAERAESSAYVPARAVWASGPGRKASGPASATEGIPVELTVRHSPPRLQQAPQHIPSQARVSASHNYYEDVDPRFSESPPPAPPALLLPGPSSQAPRVQDESDDRYLQAQRNHLVQASSYDSFQEAPPSDASEFTSVSQRDINPQWRPEPRQTGSEYATGGVPNRRPVAQQPDVLASNPDFEIGRARGGGSW